MATEGLGSLGIGRVAWASTARSSTTANSPSTKTSWPSDEAKVNYYKMDIELMFSQNPFLGRFGGQFSSIRPNDTTVIKLDTTKTSTTFDLPPAFTNSNVMIEITSAGVTRSQAYYPNSLSLNFIDT